MTVGFVLGDLDLMDKNGSPFAIETLADSTDWGNPQPIEVAVRSLLQDGSIVVHQGDDNREIALRVVITAPDSVALAEGEAELMAELYRPNALTYTPADGWGPPTVFRVVTSSLTYTKDDLAEVKLSERHYSVRLVCEPFGRSEDEVTEEALAATGTTTTDLDTMGATTGWSATINGAAATIVAAAGPPSTLTVSQAATKLAYLFSWTKTFAATTTSLKYLVVDWKPTPSSDGPLMAFGDGVALTRIAEASSPTAGFTRTWFYVDAAALAVLRFDWDSPKKNQNTARSISFDNIAISDVNPGIGTQRQQIRTVEVVGSVRTQGALSVESDTSALGDALVYCYPSGDNTTGYVPALRQRRAAGNSVTSDGTLLSGARESILSPGISYEIPVSQLPTGSYELLVRLATSGGGTPTITYTAQAALNATNVGPAVTGSRLVTTTTAYQTFTIGRLQLPTVDFAEGSGAVMSLNILASTTCTLDEAWLFNTTIGQLVRVSCGTGSGAVGGSARRLFIEPATTQTPRPTVRIGHSDDRSDSFFPPTMEAWQFPEFAPEAVNVFTATSNATDVQVALRHYPRWHTHAGL